MKRSRTSVWRDKKRLCLTRRYEPRSDEDEDRLYREHDHAAAPQSPDTRTSEQTASSTYSSSQVSISTPTSFAATNSTTVPTIRSSTNESMEHDEQLDVVMPDLSETQSNDGSIDDQSTEDDDSEEENLIYREYGDQGSDEEVEEDDSFLKLKNILANDETVTLKVTVNKAELMLAGLKFGFEHELCQTGMADLFKLINSTLHTKLLPETRYLIDRIFNASNGVQNHAVCPNPNCNSYVGEFNRQTREILCNVCGEMINLKSPCYHSFFAVFNVENDISHLLSQNWEHVRAVIEKRFEQYDVINDFCDGNLLKEFVRSLPPEERRNFVTATFNSDGAPVFESAQFSIWPVQMILNELPYDIRTSKTITLALWFGKFKPNMNIYLQPCVDVMNRLSNVGIQVQVNNVVQNMKIHTLCCCVDSSARAPMQGIVQYNGYFGCSWCMHPGVYIPTLRGGSVKYVLLDEVPPRRNQLELIHHVQLSVENNAPVFGVKGPSSLINSDTLDMVRGLVPDPLHCADRGVGLQVTGYWCDSSNLPFSLSAKDIKIADRLLKQIKAPNQITRLSRGLHDRSWWNAREWSNWISFYSIPVLSQFPHMEPYLKHWKLYVEAYYINNKDNITPAELQRAHELFLDFEGQMETLYTQHSMTYNVHQSELLTQSTLDWGPFFAHSGYCFEAGNGRLLRKIHAAKGVLFQLCRSISMSQSEIILRQHLQNQPFTQLRAYIDILDNRYAKYSKRGNHCRYFGVSSRTKTKWIRELNLSRYSRTFTKIVKDGCLYTTSRRKRIRSNNSYALTINGTYVKLRDFIFDGDTEEEYALCKTIDVVDNNTLPIKEIIEIADNVVAIETSTILKICVYVANDNKQFLCAVPNGHHY